MGRGDKRTKKGKIAMGSFGKIRPAKVTKSAAVAPVEKEAPKKKAAPKKAKSKE